MVRPTPRAEMQNRNDTMLKHGEITLDFLQHIWSYETGDLEITLIDGTIYRSAADFMFLDGLSIIADKHRIYIPKSSIKQIKICTPGE